MKRRKICSVCGAEAGSHEQHSNRDTGFGLCSSCVPWLEGRGMSAAEMTDLYGAEGVHWSREVQS